jgi:hypothetical protein
MSTRLESLAATFDISAEPPKADRILKPGRPTTARVRVLNNRVVVKDFLHTPLWFQATAARLLIRYEACVCRRLGPLDGLPEFMGRPDSCTLLFKFVSGDNCRTLPAGQLTPSFFHELQTLLEVVRNQGFLHLDVGRNVIRASDGRPFLCDFASCLSVNWLPLCFRRAVIRLRERYDLREVSKLKQRKAPLLLEEDDLERISELLPMERFLKPLEKLQKRLCRFLDRKLSPVR